MRKLTFAERALLSEKDKKYDPKATADDCVEDLRKIQEKFPLKHITRNFYRANGKYSDSTWNQFFGSFQEFRRQARLELSRNQHALERQIAKHASVDVYRKFYNEEILPYHQKFSRTKEQKGRFKTILVGSDLHDIEIDPFVLDVFIDTAERVQPDVIVFNGDLFDNYEFSRYTQDPRQMDIVKRFNFVKDKIFTPIRKKCPKAQIDLIAGNHEARLMKLLADKTPAMRVLLSDVMGLTLSQVFGLDEFEINLVSKFDLAAWSPNDINEEVKNNYQVYYNSFVCCHYKDLRFGLSGTSGHTHHPEQVTFRNIPMGNLIWTTTGCMAHIDAEYTEGFTQWQNSFLLAMVDIEKRFVSHNHITIPGDHVVIEGKLYTRKDED